MQTMAGVPTDTGPAFIAGLPIDKRVRRLVHTLNRIPGVTTYSSCGGHCNHSLGQVAAGTFYVELVASSGRVGYRAIQLIVRAIDVLSPT
jgi:Methyltransferase TYW3